MARSPAVIAGIGDTEFSRSSTSSSLTLNLRASLAACADAGIEPTTIDGIVAPAVLGATADDLCTAFGLPDLSFTATVQSGGAGPAAAVGIAAKAVEAGLCTRALVSFGYNGYSESRLGYKPPQIMFGESPVFRRNYEAYNGLLLPVQYYALWATRYMDEYGWKDTEPFATVAVTQRANAARNERAMMRTPITVEEHQSSRMISSPFRLLDCSQETDGAAAVVITRAADADRDTGSSPVAVLGVAQGKPPSPDQSVTRAPFLASAFTGASRRAFAMAERTPGDIDFAEIYDPFTFHVVWQLESLGFCAPGEARDFIQAGQISSTASMPVNTHGGLLSEAHLWGMNHVTEAVRQLRGTAGGTQLDQPQTGLVTGTGDFGDASVLVLGRAS
jgi:acetyl-CoA acetyltransferase